MQCRAIIASFIAKRVAMVHKRSFKHPASATSNLDQLQILLVDQCVKRGGVMKVGSISAAMKMDDVSHSFFVSTCKWILRNSLNAKKEMKFCNPIELK